MVTLSLDLTSSLVSPYSVPVLVTAICVLALGTLLLVFDQGSFVSIAFAALSLSIAIGLVARAGTYAAPGPDVARWWAKSAYLGVSFIPPAAYTFATIVVGTYRQRRRWIIAAWLVALGLAILCFGTNALFADLYRYPWGYYPRYRPTIALVLASFGVPFLLCLREYRLALRRAPPTTIYYRRARTLQIAFALGYLAGVDFLPGFGVAVYPFGYLVVLTFLGVIGWSILRYRLVDITPAFAATRIFETLSDGILVLDADGVIRLVNPAARALFGSRAHDLVGRAAAAVLGEDLAASLVAWLDNVDVVRNREITYARDRYDLRTLALSLSRMRDGRGRLMATICVARDVTEGASLVERVRRQGEELREVHDELERTREQFVEKERLYTVGLMASGIAHNFNNALTPILSYGSLMLERPQVAESPEHRAKYLRLMVQAGRDAVRTLARLREFYRPTADDEQRADVDLHRLVGEVVELTRPRWQDQAILQGRRIEVVTALEETPRVAGKPSELREVLTNLIFNAVDATPRSGTITLRTRSDGDHAVLQVADTGDGMSEEVRRRCFEPFFTTKGERGTGLGLPSIHAIVSRAGGTIDVDSASGRGTTFTIRLPVRAPARTVAAEPAAWVSPKNILLVDDDDDSRLALRACLTGDGHRVTEASGPRDLVSDVDLNAFDVIIVDGSSGSSALVREAATLEQRRPVLMVTGYAELATRPGELPPGIDLVVAKPVGASELRQALGRLLPE